MRHPAPQAPFSLDASAPDGSPAPLRVLHLEPDEGDAERARRALEEYGFAVAVTRVDTCDAAEATLADAADAEPFDVLLAAGNVPGCSVADLRRLVQSACPILPVLLVSEDISEEATLTTVHQGAADHVRKDDLGRLGLAVRSVLRQQALEVDRTRALDALARSLARYHAVTALVSDVAYEACIAPDGTLTLAWLTPDACRLLQDDPCATPNPCDEIDLQTLYERVHPADRRAALRHHLRVRRGETADVDLRVHRADGTYLWVHHVARLALAAGEHAAAGACIIGAFTDITPRKEAEQARREAQQAAEAARRAAETTSRVKAALLTNMSHEVRTPLTSIIGFAELLTETKTAEERAYARGIVQSSRRLQETLVSILTLARLEADETEILLQPLCVADHVREVAGLFRTEAQAKGLRFDVEIDEAARGTHAMLDQGALSGILQHLLRNAVKFSDGGGITVSLSHAPAAADAEAGCPLLLQVADTGVGIAPAFVEHLFTPFAQEATGYSRAYEGCGLGLSIAQKLTKKLGGSIAVTSEKGQGATFTVRLPSLKVHTEAPSMPLREPTHRARLLVVEDDPNTRVFLERVLSDTYDVHVAATAAEAILAAQRARVPFEAALVDINLGSSLGGADVLRALRSLPQYACLPTAAVTAYAEPGDRQRFLHLGFTDYLAKPFLMKDVEALVRQLLSGTPSTATTGPLLAFEPHSSAGAATA